MNKKEISIVKRMLGKGKGSITQLNCCYIRQNGSVIEETKENFVMLTDEEQEKYLTIFKKCLTGKEGKNQISIDFPLEAERSGHMQAMLYTWTQGFETPTEVYQRIIQSYTWDGDQFVILLGSGIYNLPAKASDGTVLEDSENVYRFTICCICPVDLAGEGLVYSKEDTSFKAMEKKWTIQAPVNGFLFPSFHDGGPDIHSLLYFSKKELHAEFITYGLECGLPLSETDQQEYFSAAIAEAFPDNYTLDTAAQVYQKVQEYIETEKETLDVKELQGLLKECGAKEERLKRIEEFPEQLSLHTKNIIDEKKYVIEGPGVKVQVDADNMDVLEYKQIDGRSYLCIPVDVGLKKDDIALK